MYAGEGFTSTEEIARPEDVTGNPWIQGMVGKEGDEWPGPRLPKRR